MFNIKYRYLIILLLALYSYINILFTEGDTLINSVYNPQISLFITLLFLVILVWEGNRLIELRLLKKPNPTGKINPLIVFFLLSLIVVYAVSALTWILLSVAMQQPALSLLTELKLIIGFAFRINLFLNCINGIVYYMKQYRRSQLQAERLEKATAEAQYESLRNQLNPHFLFNSFNVLSSLVYKDPDMSAKFVRQMSKVYRYLLYHQEGSTVSLRDELSFLHAYLYLLNIRFGENLKVETDIPDKYQAMYLAPVSMQLLIENAIKHNVVSARRPLSINIYVENGQGSTREAVSYLVVENSLQRKEVVQDSTQKGLSNIRRRYRFITDNEVQIEESDDMFSVKLPLLHNT